MSWQTDNHNQSQTIIRVQLELNFHLRQTSPSSHIWRAIQSRKVKKYIGCEVSCFLRRIFASSDPINYTLTSLSKSALGIVLKRGYRCPRLNLTSDALKFEVHFKNDPFRTISSHFFADCIYNIWQMSWQTDNHNQSQTIHPTENFISLNLFKIL